MPELTHTITIDALHVFAALLLVCVTLDALTHTKWATALQEDPPRYVAAFALIGFALANAALGGAWQLAALVTVALVGLHIVVLWLLPEDYKSTLTTFLLTIATQIAAITALALHTPNAIAAGIWGQVADLAYAPALIISGGILSVWAGGRVVGRLTFPFQDEVVSNSLPNAGRLIGQLERAIIFLLILVQQPAGVGFLIAAKSVLRFDTAAQGQKASEYVIIGTLASFAWALTVSYITVTLLEIATKAP